MFLEEALGKIRKDETQLMANEGYISYGGVFSAIGFREGRLYVCSVDDEEKTILVFEGDSFMYLTNNRRMLSNDKWVVFAKEKYREED